MDPSYNNGGNNMRSAASPSQMSRSRFSPDNAMGGRSPLQEIMQGRASRQSPYGGPRVSYSRGASVSRAGSVAQRENMAHINELNSPDAIERERHLAKVREDLRKEFELIDADGSGTVDK